MYIKLDKDVFENNSKDTMLKAVLAEKAILECNGKVEYIPSGTITTCCYKVDIIPRDDIENGIKWRIIE